MAAPRLDRLFPNPSTGIDLADQYRGHRPPVDGRPWVMVGMVQSLDGATAIDGTSGALGNANDRLALRTLRHLADMIIVGAATAAGEGYGPPSDPNLRIAVATNSGRVDATSDLFRSGAGLVVAPRAAAVPDGVEAIIAGDTELDIVAALEQIADIFPATELIVAEGGPTFNGSLLAAGVVDELCVTTAPMLVGGDSDRTFVAAEQVCQRFELAHLLVDSEGYQFQRWIRADR